MVINNIQHLKGSITVPGDKSISHRSVMLGSLAEGKTRISHFLFGDDCLATIECFKKMGILIETDPSHIVIHGKGLHGLTKPSSSLYAANSGTTMRLMAGILSGQDFSSSIYGDDSLNKRPMKRILTPLTMMDANIKSTLDNGCAPLMIQPSSLHGIVYNTPVASAQVKSSILFAGLYANSPTTVKEPSISRNHTELMLRDFGADLTSLGTSVTIFPCSRLTGQDLIIPGDISSAAYMIAAGLIIPDSEILIKNVGINPTRAGFLSVCEKMGAKIEFLNVSSSGSEPCADLLVRTSHLKGTVIEGDLIPSLIDEIPILAVLAAFAEGTTVIRDAKELKVKESDRIESVTYNLKHMGGNITPTEDGMIIHGCSPLHGTKIKTYHDHRIAMAFSIAALSAEGESSLDDESCIRISYPDFFDTISYLAK